VQFREVRIEPTGCHDHQRGGGTVDGAKLMWDMAGQEHETARLGMEPVAAALDIEYAGEHVQALVFAPMGVTWRATVDCDLNDGEIAAG
jgi:hypothetical protein